MVLGKLPVPGRPTSWITVGQGPTALAVGAGGGYLDIFTLICPFSPLSLSLWETARYRLKYCPKGPLNPKQPTNQTTNQSTSHPRHLVGKRTAQIDIIKNITIDSQVNSNFPYRCSPASLTFNNYFLPFFVFLYSENNHK